MKDSFDPYRKWLGIPSRDQPPHHYRLLGIEPLEPDADVISNAADGRMAQVKNFQAGKYSELSQKILNEIAAAKVCLLNREKKAEYDRKLKGRLEAEKRPAPKAALPAGRKPKPTTSAAAEAEIPQLQTAPLSSYVSSHRPKKRPWQVPVAIGAAGVLAVGLLIFLLSQSGDGRTSARRPKPPQSQPEDQPQASASPAPSGGPKNPKEPEAPQKPADSGAEHPTPGPQEQPTGQGTTPSEVGPALVDLIDPPDTKQPGSGTSDPEPDQPQPDQPQPDVPTHPKRLPVPDEDARQEAENKVREVFKADFADARTPDKKLELAAKLFKKAEQAGGDPTERFAMLQLACETAADAGELRETLKMVDQMREDYDIDALAMKADLLRKVVGALGTGPKASPAGRQIADAAMQLAEEAVAADNFETGGALASVAASAARRTKDTSLIGEATKRGREIDRLRVRFASIRKALDVLAENPADGEANLTAGRWYCFTKGNWDKGRPYLVKAKDPELAGLARQDMDGPKDSKQQVELADGWWSRAKKEASLTRPAVQARAAYWYDQALPKLTGLDKVIVEKRLEAIKAAAEPERPKMGGVVERGNVALAANGALVRGKINNAAKLLDGDTGVDCGYAYSKYPCEWIIVLKQVYRLQEIRFSLRTRDNRFYRYALGTSADGETYVMLEDRSKGEWAGWQRIKFSPRPVKTIKLIGLHNSKNNTFYVEEFEAYCVPPGPLRK